MASTISPNQQVFGVDLETLVNSQADRKPQIESPNCPKDLPFVVVETIGWLETHNAIAEEGLFRIPGNGQQIQLIKKDYNEGKADLSKFTNADIHTIAGVLKLYLRELPEPLFIWRYYSTFIKVIKNPDFLQRLLHLRMLIYGLPKVNRDLVLFMMTFLNKVSSNCSVNKMTSTNLAVVFAPNILRHQKESLNQIMEDSTHEISYISKVSKDKITHHLSTSSTDVPSPVLPKSAESGSKLSLSTGLPNSESTEFLYARALYPYQTSGQWHLPFAKDDQITLLDIKSEEGWMKGEYNGRVGYFPASYVEIIALPPPTTPVTLIPIPDLDQQADCTIITTTTTTTQQTTTTTTTTTTTMISGATAPGAPPPLLATPAPISSSNSNSFNNGTKRTPLASSAGQLTSPATNTPPTHKSSGSSSSLTNSPKITPSTSKLNLASSGTIPPPPALSTPPPPLVAPMMNPGSNLSLNSSSKTTISSSSSSQNISRSGSFVSNNNNANNSSNTSPDLGKVMSITPKLSFSGALPPSLTLPPPLLPSRLPGVVQTTPPQPNASVSGSKSGSFIDFSLNTPPPPPPLSLPSENIPAPLSSMSTPVKAPPPIDLNKLPPPPFSPCSPEPNTIDATTSINITTDIPPPPVFDMPLPPPPLSSSDLNASLTGSSNNMDSSDTSSIDDTSSLTSGHDIPLPPPPVNLDEFTSPVIDEAKIAEIRKKRKERAEEMLTTERTYVKQLNCIYEHFIEPSKRNNKIYCLSEEMLNTFSCLEVILNAHKTNILKALEERMLVWDDKPKMGDIFCNNTSFIKLYKHYVNNYDKSIVSLKQCKEKNSEFRNFVKTLDYSEKFSGLNVESFLILPVQRIPRYVLLLQDLLKYTDNSHEDFDQLCEALGTIKDFAETINYKKSEEDNYTRIQQIQETIKNLPPHMLERRKRFVHEGPLATKKDKYYLFLFSDALLLTKSSKDKKKFKQFINLQTASLNTTDEAGVIKIISQEGTYKFLCENVKDRDFWIKTFKDTIEMARQEMIQSAFGDSVLQNEGSKGFNRIQDEKNALKKQKLAEELSSSEQEYVTSLQYIQNVFLSPIHDYEALFKVVNNLKEQNDKFNTASMLSASTGIEMGSRSPHKSKTLRIKQPKGLSKDSKINTSGYFSV
ncbi:pleckstrin domain-containing protein [Heterostelium album PN500]|uniref:Pleckstrin domain-containing protein n=1 Tax=Heterostelium pallidum (strain ATCC 26659 / Pp 5 / PN500) TaxID=670386 RepID=D3B2X0_HETP5|nr:pleckstrin domain-containing protein [Heterostelium album PN500]EFA83668.1 pleckstrin domain-containing protein [Heterostelium album PN500]|eukprot:XP_020435785.1 pleckstrin domain-containing protein [Heterostelium album PN500]